MNIPQGILASFFFAALNRLRGSDFGKPYTSDGVIAAVEAFSIGGYTLWRGEAWQDAALLSAALFGGLWLWAAPGWGAGFAAIHGRWAANGRLSLCVEKLVSDPYWRGIVYMSCRGFLGFLPLALCLAALGHIWAATLLVTVGAAMGPVYWIGGIHQRATGKDTGVPASEFLIGALIGGALWMTL